jgi:NADH-quinone oxidoreductase subunit C
MRRVEPQNWRTTLLGVKASGLGFLDVLTAIDREDHLEVIVHVVDLDTGARDLVTTLVPAEGATLDSIASVFPAAGWHERETAEMFGITFDGHPDPRPLLLRSTLGAPPLRKSTVLAARAVQPWPGASDPGTGASSRRRPPPSGVPDGWLREGDG